MCSSSALEMLKNTVKNMWLQEEKACFCSVGKKEIAQKGASPSGRAGE